MSTKEYREKNKELINKKKREWYKLNSKKVQKEVHDRRTKLREWLNEFKSTKECTLCGEKHIACLDFHHTNPEEKEIDPSQMISNGWSKERMIKELDKCIILCANCHRKMHS